MKPDRIDRIFSILSAANPAPKTELNYENPFTLLVAVVLSAQATDAGVNKATKSLFSKIKTPEQMMKFGEAKLRSAIKSINFFNMKAKHVIGLSKKLVEDFDGQVPRDASDLQSLPGVGRKTANVVLNVVWGEKTIAVDTHVFRVANRLGLAKGKTPEEVENKLLKVVPLQWRDHAHHWLILHGRYVCKARKPECAKCALRELCEFKEKTC
jgi:endonuclease-3